MGVSNFGPEYTGETVEHSFRWAALWFSLGTIALQLLGSCGQAGKGCRQDSDCGVGGVCPQGSRVCFSPVEEAPSIVTSRLPEGIVSRPYEHTLVADGGTNPLQWTLVNPSPELNWLSLNPDSGVLSGQPATSQSLPLTVQVKDAVERMDRKTLNLSVRNCVIAETFDCMVPSGQACFKGQQSCTESGQVTACTATIGSPSSDRSKCGPSCSPCSTHADRCAEGVCKCGGADGCSNAAPQCCGTPDGGSACANTQTNPDFCGGCGISCDRGRRNVIRGCDAGHCEYPCAPGFGRCPADSREPDCSTDLKTTDNCGRCGNRCPAPAGDGGFAVCEAGQCRQRCSQGFQLCNGICVPLNDVNHCGNCSTVCPAPTGGRATCEGNPLRCGMRCSGTDQLCGMACFPLNDVNHCGSCATVCPPPTGGTATCEGNPPRCGQRCPTGYLPCGNACRNIATDVDHCGACDQPCRVEGGQRVCSNGVCSASCPPERPHQCGSGRNLYCASFDDIGNCGGCGRVCRVHDGTASCPGATCTPSCPNSFAPNLCGSDHDFICTNFRIDFYNCGGCGRSCGENERCENGICRSTCPTCYGQTCCPPRECDPELRRCI